MLRVIASTVLLVLLAPLGLPAAITLGGSSPVCCRANGAHHCTASLPADAEHAVTSQQRCPHTHPVVLPHPANPQNDSRVPTAEEAHPFLQEFVPGIHVTDSRDNHSDRGPPVASR